MRKVATTIAILFYTMLVFGDDGTYLTKGGLIYPTKETKISMDKEILSFTCANNKAQVDIYFEFNNPESVDRKLLLGFQAPAARGGATDEELFNNQIKNFRIIKDGEILPYKLKYAHYEDSALYEPSEIKHTEEGGGIFVYLFEVTFKPGINKIYHSYEYPASINTETDQIYNYILTTGSKWANGIIKDLTVQIDMGTNKYFYLTDIFGKNADWSIIGTGKFDYYDDTCRMVRILSGKLQIKTTDFKPEHDIEFGIFNNNVFVTNTYADYVNAINTDKALRYFKTDLKDYDIEPFTKAELKIIRNTIYAQYGYAFKTKELQDYFNKYEWYIPDPNLSLDQIKLTEKEKKFIAEIMELEKK